MTSLIRFLPTAIKLLAGVGAGNLLNKIAADANVRRSIPSNVIPMLPIITAAAGAILVLFISKKAKI